MQVFIGTAGWTVPKQHVALFARPVEGTKPSHLERYASQLRCAEINSSFHRRHRRSTWERWAAATSEDFRFAVKMPKAITHTAKLMKTGGALLEFFGDVSGLGHKLGPLLVQLPPKLLFDEGLAHEFLTTLRELHTGAVVLEPRHASWFTSPVDRLLCDFEVFRVAADPPKGSDAASRPGGATDLIYWRLHGSPRTYYSDYDQQWLHDFAVKLKPSTTKTKQLWVIFDNTALGHATANAIELKAALKVI
jgi:uncharacterized protein YecE (DUF72 family)